MNPFAAFPSRRKDCGAVITEDCRTGILHRDGCPGYTVKTLSAMGLTPYVIGIGIFIHIERETLGVIGKKKLLGSVGKAQSSQSVSVVCFDKSLLLEIGYNGFFIADTT
jgi:hypothetical protein